ncbi:aminotransferase class V-fold PLP-dependent enzyme [Fulvivirga sp. RKSG066]|uniref:pyridoxal phosphate-dependent decarboxylase family protein n=1 Tax=Fulvivirga aurantia TaxID=2529383 RepID=UPI0012BB857E|nr:aminotransferase class V-fold PLP-dependent enzyme [Fulvivirga aurantia]MTI22557.1 aminotransferase class V-fold PLP-dependent enzyme [Fulvivirga aurantia]
MRDKIESLQQQSAALEPDQKERAKIRDAVVKETEKFLNNIHDFEKSPTYFSKVNGKEIMDYPIADEPIGIEQSVRLITDNIDKTGITGSSGGHLGYIPGGGIYSSSLGDYWADITNSYAGVYFASPGGVRLENHLLNWMRDMVGYPDTTYGNLASGGSIANLTAIVTARDAYNIKGANVPEHVIYLSKQAHHCIDKALHIAGLRECVVRTIDLDDQYRLNIQSLEEQVSEDVKKGLKPFMMIASAGTTDTGAIDPIDEIADLADKYKAWFHVDAAYGGFFMLTNEGRKKFSGIERSDSMVLDPHKGLFLPFGVGVVLVKNGELMRKSFSYFASYMQDIVVQQGEISPADVSPELTKHFRGLRMWLPLMLHGVRPFRACLEEKLLLARYAYEALQKMEHVEVGPAPELSIVTFRFVPPGTDANDFNEALVKAIHDDGRIFISSTTIDGVFTLRLAILAFRTHLDTIDLILEILKEKAKELYK